MVFGNLKLIEARKMHAVGVNHEIENMTASFAFKMTVYRRIGIVAHFVVFNIDHKSNSLRNKELECVVNCCFR